MFRSFWGFGNLFRSLVPSLTRVMLLLSSGVKKTEAWDLVRFQKRWATNTAYHERETHTVASIFTTKTWTVYLDMHSCEKSRMCSFTWKHWVESARTDRILITNSHQAGKKPGNVISGLIGSRQGHSVTIPIFRRRKVHAAYALSRTSSCIKHRWWGR